MLKNRGEKASEAQVEYEAKKIERPFCDCECHKDHQIYEGGEIDVPNMKPDNGGEIGQPIQMPDDGGDVIKPNNFPNLKPDDGCDKKPNIFGGGELKPLTGDDSWWDKATPNTDNTAEKQTPYDGGDRVPNQKPDDGGDVIKPNWKKLPNIMDKNMTRDKIQ